MTEPGYRLLPGACLDQLDAIRLAADVLLAGGHAARNALRRSPGIAAAAAAWSTHPAVTGILGAGAFPVRGMVFDKIPGANWQVPWHRDRILAVARRIDLPGWGPWSLKDGVDHVEPPPDWPQRRLSLRLHLDDCPADNGAIQVVPGSHLELQRDGPGPDAPATTITATAGDVLVLHPLLLHCSAPARAPAHRRILHLEFANGGLPGGLDWESRA